MPRDCFVLFRVHKVANIWQHDISLLCISKKFLYTVLQQQLSYKVSVHEAVLESNPDSPHDPAWGHTEGQAGRLPQGDIPFVAGWTSAPSRRRAASGADKNRNTNDNGHFSPPEEPASFLTQLWMSVQSICGLDTGGGRVLIFNFTGCLSCGRLSALVRTTVSLFSPCHTADGTLARLWLNGGPPSATLAQHPAIVWPLSINAAGIVPHALSGSQQMVGLVHCLETFANLYFVSTGHQTTFYSYSTCENIHVSFKFYLSLLL